MACDKNNPEWNPHSGYDPIHRSMGECFNPNLSIFIPYVFKNSNTKNFIKNTLYEKKIGIVYHIDLKRTKKNNNKWCAFVYIRWYTNEVTLNIQNEIIGNDKSYKFDYTENNYWIFLKNKNPMTEEKMIQQEENILKRKIIKMNNEYLEKIDYYSRNHIEAKRIAKKGWERGHKDYNERIITNYFLDIALNNKPTQDYSWPIHQFYK